MPVTLQLEKFATQVRRDIVRMVHAVQSGHPGDSLGTTEFLTVLYQEIMNYSTDFKMDGVDEDLFFLSNGHVSPVLYSVLARSGFFPVEELETFRKLGTRLQGHPTNHENLPGIRVSSGSLGQGLSVSIGASLAKKLNGDKHYIYTLLGDGELQEGQNWEAIMYASANKVDNLIATIDYNNAQIDGSVDEILSLGNLRIKFEAFGWLVIDIKKGNDIASIIKGLNEAKKIAGFGKPVCILLHTQMGHGVDFMMGSNAWHGKPPSEEQLAAALAQNKETLGDY